MLRVLSDHENLKLVVQVKDQTTDYYEACLDQ